MNVVLCIPYAIESVHAVSHSMYSLPFHDDTCSAQHGNQ